ncbi:MAG: hypothetical protein MRZ79_11570 [Bacteroidia bacterium]|nr:hypothetical protein [Bacteroidia bacterium]
MEKERLYQLFKESFLRDLSEDELKELQEVSEKDPYFVLPKLLSAKGGKEGALQEAAVHSANRKLLRDFLRGKLYFAEIEIDPLMSEQSGRKSYHVLFPPNPFDHFGILEGIGTDSFSLEPTSPLSISGQFSNKKELAFLQNIIEEKVFRYKGLVEDIQGQLRQRLEKEAWKFKKTVEADGLVNQFLEHLPQIAPPRLPDDLSQQEEHLAAKKSLEDHEEEFVTETLAKLHIKQKNKAEALRIYEILSLRFPEKSAYFEAQIKKLKE